MIDRIAGKLGFQRIERLEHNDAIESSIESKVPEYLSDEALFDWGRAFIGTFSFSYSDDDLYHFAVGRHGWMPLVIAAFSMAGNQTDGQSLMANAISGSLWLDPLSERYATWVSANEIVFNSLQDIEGIGSKNKSDISQFDNMSSSAVSYVFRQQWRQRYPSSGEDHLAISEAHASYYDKATIADARRAVDESYASTLGMVRRWFEVHGFEVSDDQQHIRIDAYKPLFYVAEQCY